MADYPLDTDILSGQVSNDPREAVFPETEEKINPAAETKKSKAEAGAMVNQEATEAASQHGLKVKQEEGKPAILEAENEEKTTAENEVPRKEKDGKLPLEGKDVIKGKSNLPASEEQKEKSNLKVEVKQGKEELPEKKAAEEEKSDQPEVPLREPAFADFMDYINSGMTEEQEYAAVAELRAGIITNAEAQKQNVTQSAAEQKEMVRTTSQAKVEEIQQGMEQETAAIKSLYSSAIAHIDASASKEKKALADNFEKKKSKIEADTLKKVLELENEIARRAKNFLEYAQEQKKMPQQYSLEEAGYADAELDKAIAKSYSIGNLQAGKYPGNEDKRPQQREAAQTVAKESAADIRAKKAPIRQSLIKEADNFKGDYDTFITEVLQELETCKQTLKPIIEEKGKSSVTKLEELNKKSIELIDKQLQGDKEKLSLAETSSLERLEKNGKSTIGMVRKQGADGQANIGQMEKSILSQIESSQTKYLGIIDQQSVPNFQAVQELSNEVSLEISDAVAAGREAMQGSVSDLASSFEQLGNAFTTQSEKMLNEARVNTEGIKKAFDAAMQKVSESFQKESETIAKTSEEEQGLVISDSMKGLDKFIQQRRDKLAEVNAQFKEKVKSKAAESLEKSKLPLTDPLEERVAEAAQKADQPWWKGALDALASLVVGLIIIIAIVAILIALGVSGTVLLVVGLVALAAFGIYEAYKRYKDGFSLGQSILWGFGDVIGYTGVYEGISGQMVVPPGHDPVILSSYERGRRTTEGGVNLLLMLAPLKAKIPGIRRIPGLPILFRGVKGMIPPGLLKDGAVLARVFEAVSKGGSKVSEVIGEGMKVLEEQGARSRKFYKSVFEKLAGKTKPLPIEGVVVPEPVAPVEKVDPVKEIPKQEVAPVENPVKTPEVAPKPNPEPVHPDVSETGFGGYRATFKGDPKAFAMFEPEGSGVHVSDLFRGAQPKGSGGTMLAESLNAAKIPQPTEIRFTNILDTQPSLKQLADGVPIGETVLGNTLKGTVEKLGGVITEWKTGTTKGKQWIEAIIKYPEPPVKGVNPIKSEKISDPEGLLKKEEVPVTEEKITPENDKTRPLESQADPVKDVLGPGRVSHPAEWEGMLKSMEDAGVEIRFTEPGKEQLAYAPGLREGQPGQLIIDPDASISALKHEYQHFLDDQAIGFGGMQTLFNAPLRYEWEFRAYYEEIKLMRQKREFDTARKLLENLRKEKAILERDLGPVKPEVKDAEGLLKNSEAPKEKIVLSEDFKEVEIVNEKGSPIGEFDGVDIKNKGFIEDKSAKGLNTLHPRTGKPVQTPAEWANKQIIEKTKIRIANLNKASATRPTKNGSPSVPDLRDIQPFKKLQFRIDSDEPELVKAVEAALKDLKRDFPDWDFSAIFNK